VLDILKLKVPSHFPSKETRQITPFESFDKRDVNLMMTVLQNVITKTAELLVPINSDKLLELFYIKTTSSWQQSIVDFEDIRKALTALPKNSIERDVLLALVSHTFIAEDCKTIFDLSKREIIKSWSYDFAETTQPEGYIFFTVSKFSKCC
jgi:hypothetical protein